MRRRKFQALVEHHHDVAPQRQLHIHHRLRREHVRIAVQVRPEQHPRIGHFAQSAQAEHLETARVRQDCARPVHEAVQPAEPLDHLVPRPQVEMIGIGQQDRYPQIVLQIPLHQPLHGGLRPHRHEHGRFDHAVRRVQQPGPRPRHRALGHHLKSYSAHV